MASMHVIAIANKDVVRELVGPDVNGEVVVGRVIAHVGQIVFEVVGVAVNAVFVYAKVQDCIAALVKWVVTLALRGGSLFSVNDDLRVLVFGTSMDRRFLT